MKLRQFPSRLTTASFAVSLIAASVVVPATQPAAASVSSSAASTADCSQLATQGYCQLGYAQHPGQTDVQLPVYVGTVTFVLSGASGGGGGKDNQGLAGTGGTIVGTLTVPSDHRLTVWLGQDGSGPDGATTGWSKGGAGGHGRNQDGAAGGGASGIAWASDGHDKPLAVAAGGGGGGGSQAFENVRNGGIGGAGGKPPTAGGTGTSTGYAGAGGRGGGASKSDGDAGRGGHSNYYASGGGGGGGGYLHGGGPGIEGEHANVKVPAQAAGGGGGGVSYASPSVAGAYYASGHAGAGSLMLFAGSPLPRKSCTESTQPRQLNVPSDVKSYGFVAVGGSGTHGHNNVPEGSGAIDTGSLDVTNISALDYWVGCDGYNHSGAGYGKTGSGGKGGADGNNGGRGGGASAIADSRTGTVLVAAGGGGGSGGDSTGCPTYPGENCGGRGGSSGGKAFTRVPADGAPGGGGTGAGGGCSNCNGGKHPNRNGGGGHSSGSYTQATGGGGGGGAGYPAGGAGGHHITSYPAGGGGAGGAYLSRERVHAGAIDTTAVTGSGFILLIPFVASTTSLTVSKSVEGAAKAFGGGPFTVDVSCTLAGATTLHQTISLTAGASRTLPGIPSGSNCRVTETGTGGASTPASPQTILLGTSPAKVTLTNTFAATSLTVNLRSVITAQNGGPNPGVSFSLAELGVHVACTLNGQSVTMPSPVSGGRLDYTGDDTWAAGGVTQTIVGLPVGASCQVAEAAGSGASFIGYTVDGETVSGDGAAIVLGAGANGVGIKNVFQLGSLTISKTAAGSSTPPPGQTYSGEVGCTFQGRPVALALPHSFSVTVGGTDAVPNLPEGAQCTVNETDQGSAVAVTYSPAQTVTITSSPMSSVIITNTFDNGSLLVSVDSHGTAAHWGNVPPQVHVTCTLGGQTVLDETFTAQNAGGGWRSFRPDGSSLCSASEIDSGGATSVAYTSSVDRTPSSQPVSVGIAEDGTATLLIHNDFVASPLTIETETEGAGAQFAQPTTERVDQCTFNGLAIDVTSGSDAVTFTLPGAGGSATIPELPTGSACVVSQASAGGASAENLSSTDADPATMLGQQAMRVTVNQVAAGAGTTVHVTNTFDVGSLPVGVVVQGAAAWAANTPYAVQVSCSFQGKPITQLGPDGTVTLSFAPDGTPVADTSSAALETLPLGATCNAAETTTGGATTVTYSPPGSSADRSADVSILLGGSPIEITNTFDQTSLTVTKAVAGNDGASHHDEEFTFEYGCTFNGSLVPPPPDDPMRPSTFTLIADSSHQVTELPVGAICGVHEIDSQHATQVAPSTDQSATLTSDPALISFTNAFDVAPLTVTESLTGDGVPSYAAAQTFRALVDCQWPDNGGSAVLPGQGILLLSAANDYTASINAPYGTRCTVAQARYLATSQRFPDPVLMGLGDQHTLSIVSSYLLGSATVTKLTEGDFPAGARFAFSTTCTWSDGRSPAVPVELNDGQSASFALQSGASRLVTVLSGSECEVTETDTGGAAATTIDVHAGSSSVSGRTATVELDDLSSALVTFTNLKTPSGGGDAGNGSLSDTGSDPLQWLPYAALILIAGVGLLLAGKRRAQ